MTGLAGLALLATTVGVSHGAQAQGPGDGPPPRADFAKMQAREADDIALLLALRADQRPALTAFLQSMAPPPPPSAGDRAPGIGDDAASDGFAHRLDRMAQDSARRTEEDTRRITAARTFYASLDPAQRRSFEALMRLRQGPGRGPGLHGPMHGGDGDPPRMGGMPPRP
ncbi:Spy/CpxP family protein refolding chaperone [Sphingomonas sp. M1A8_2b]